MKTFAIHIKCETAYELSELLSRAAVAVEQSELTVDGLEVDEYMLPCGGVELTRPE